VFAGVPAPMLARLERVLPRGPEWRYEPKLDGFRGLPCRSNAGPIRMLSRNLKDLSVSFPEIVRAAQSLPSDSVLDGEIVIADAGGHSDFGALQRRLGAGVRDAGRFADQNAAVLLTFVVPRHQGEDLTGMALRDRRARLETLLAADPGCIQVISQTPDVEEAEDWLRRPSIEGVVAKRADGRYLSGQREWVKVKHRRTADCVVIGVAGDRTTPWLVLGLRHSDLQLHHVGPPVGEGEVLRDCL
jgi:ATP-dependent DNA ligase